MLTPLAAINLTNPKPTTLVLHQPLSLRIGWFKENLQETHGFGCGFGHSFLMSEMFPSTNPLTVTPRRECSSTHHASASGSSLWNSPQLTCSNTPEKLQFRRVSDQREETTPTSDYSASFSENYGPVHACSCISDLYKLLFSQLPHSPTALNLAAWLSHVDPPTPWLALLSSGPSGPRRSNRTRPPPPRARAP